MTDLINKIRMKTIILNANIYFKNFLFYIILLKKKNKKKMLPTPIQVYFCKSEIMLCNFFKEKA